MLIMVKMVIVNLMIIMRQKCICWMSDEGVAWRGGDGVKEEEEFMWDGIGRGW